MSLNKNNDNREIFKLLFLIVIMLLIFFLQYSFRHLDDNRLTSWHWTFAYVDLKWFVPLFILGSVFAYLFAMFPFFKTRPVLFLFLFSFMISTVFWREPEVIVDTSRYFTQAKHLEIYGIRYFLQEWGREIFAWTDMPLVSFFYGLIFRFIGESRTYIQIFTTFLFSMTIVLTFLTGKTLWDEETGFFAGALLMGIPYLFSQVPLMLVDIPTMFFLMLSVLTFCKVMERGGVWTIFASLALFCAVFSKYSTWMMLSVLPVIFAVYLINPSPLTGEGMGGGVRGIFTLPFIPFRQGRGKYIYRGMAVFFIAGVLVAIIAVYKFDVISQQIVFLQEFQKPGLSRWTESFISTFLFQMHPLIALAALYSVYEAVKKRDPKFLIVFWLLLLVVLLQIKRSRYVLVIFPMVTLMASYGLQRIRDIEFKRIIVFGIVFSSLVVAIFSFLPFLQNMSVVNLRDAGEFLDSVEQENIRVFTIPLSEPVINISVAVPMIDLFSQKTIIFKDDARYSPPYDAIKTSPLRFTWEFKNPRYYSDGHKISSFTSSSPVGEGMRGNDPALVIISNGHIESFPDHIEKELNGYSKLKVFDTTERIFGFNPFVTIYLPEK